jgi:hypothetical protein
MLTVALRAEDWTTCDGKTYKSVSIVKVEPDAVTILDADGGALVPLAVLGPDLQKRFHYDPAKAKVASAARSEAGKSNALALEAETNKADALKQGAYMAQAREIQLKEAQEALRETIATAPQLHLEIIQALPTGVLADQMDASVDPSSEVDGVHFGGGGGSRVITGTMVYSLSGKTIFVHNVPTGNADGEQITVAAYRDGTYAYQDTQGAQRTVEKWDFVAVK